MSRKKRYTEDEEEQIYSSICQQTPLFSKARIDLKCKNKNQKILADLIEEKEIILARGPAGCGKTFIACSQALKMIKENSKYKKIYLIKSVTTLKDEEIGFLKGTLEEKMEPYVYSFMHNFEKIIGRGALQELKSSKTIEVMPIAYLRGLNFDDCITIVDEAQNLTKDHLVTILTRIGTNSKLILLGDTDQIDRKTKKDSGFLWIIDRCSIIEEIGTHELTIEDVVRNPIVQKIIEAVKE